MGPNVVAREVGGVDGERREVGASAAIVGNEASERDRFRCPGVRGCRAENRSVNVRWFKGICLL
jgi:hypothetical protein